jgi:hypothetical protein
MTLGTLVFLSTSSKADDSKSKVVENSGTRVEIVEDSMHEFMEYVFQPTYRRLKVSMQSAPADNKAWKPIKSDSLILAESCNLLFVRTPEQDADDWVKHTVASRDAGAELYRAAQAKKFDVAKTAWTKMLDNCNACHRKFEEGKHILAP